MHDAALAERQAERWASANRSGSKIKHSVLDVAFATFLTMKMLIVIFG